MSKDLLTEILDGATAVHTFLSTDLAKESLSPDCNHKREKYAQLLNNLCTKIRSVPLSMRPRVNTPSSMKSPKPAPPPPPADMLEITAEDEEQEMYTEMDTADIEEPEDYIAFEPAQTNDLSQEMYEAMTVEQEDVYEEPVPSASQDPSSASEGRPSTSSSLHIHTPSQSRENSASGAEFIESTREQIQLERSAILADISTDWSKIYSPPKKGSGDSKVASLKSISIRGYLEKLGGHNKKNWQKRYCVLSGPLMYFYEKESSKSYNNFICVLNFTVSVEPTMTNAKKKQFAFKLTHTDISTGNKKDYCFRANSTDVRDKWISCIEKVIQKTPPPNISSSSLAPGGSVTLPRMTSGGSLTAVPASVPKPQANTSVTNIPPVEDDAELYEDVPAPIKEESEEDDDDYLPVSPGHEDVVNELTSSEEYVPVAPTEEIEEEYEETTPYQLNQPPPPMSPPPGPPTSHPPQPTSALHTAPPTHKPAPPPPPPEVNTDKIYNQGSNGIMLKKVYVILWDFEAHETDELGLSRGDLVLVNEPTEGSDWWFGELLNNEATKKIGKKGLFPRQYTDLAFEAAS